jgi:hypothetical protein
MAKPKRTSNTNAGPLIAGRVPFQGSNMYGHAGGPTQLGWLSPNAYYSAGRNKEFSEQIGRLKNPDYTVMSYGTPIAIHHEGGWHYPDVSHSPSTGKHQSIVRGALGIKNAKELKREASAKKKAEKASAQEQSLWNQ